MQIVVKQFLTFCILASIILMTQGCGTREPLNKRGMQVKLVKEAPKNCKQIENFRTTGAEMEFAVNALRNFAAEYGATHVHVTKLETLHGVGGMNVIGGDDNVAYGDGYICK